MEVGAVKKQIKNKDLGKFYIFTGPEIEAQRIYVNKMAEVAGMEVQRIDSVGYIYNRQRSLFSKPKCYVCRDDKEFMKTEKAWDTIADVIGDNMLILLITEVDKRTKFYKRFSDEIVEFDYMKRDTLKKYILKQIGLSEYWLDSLHLVHSLQIHLLDGWKASRAGLVECWKVLTHCYMHFLLMV